MIQFLLTNKYVQSKIGLLVSSMSPDKQLTQHRDTCSWKRLHKLNNQMYMTPPCNRSSTTLHNRELIRKISQTRTQCKTLYPCLQNKRR
ncbi:hypothetical protein GDO81_023568 [Engystomops pustulosus]|uniref:Uncharacterized protein n=1 Tax=Engystomops pustulosus TaxID=76066 RepID=A0AAV6YKG7_ENGPU|nr:hypothetical protein GDO81_023568 [Engystomops pustulosus]